MVEEDRSETIWKSVHKNKTFNTSRWGEKSPSLTSDVRWSKKSNLIQERILRRKFLSRVKLKCSDTFILIIFIEIESVKSNFA